jgi:hypothetical protein
MSADLTICSVSFGDRHWIERSEALARRLNPGHRATWRLVVNEPARAADRPEDPGPFEVRRGEALSPDEAADALRRSRHHARALHVGLREIRTRFVLILDADCFLVRPAWMDDVLAHMDTHGLAFFGTPYHPRWLAKLRYFPCCVCLFVDRERVALEALDFTPGPDPGYAPPNDARAKLIRRVDRTFARRGMAPRTFSEVSQDTGVRVYRRYRDRPDTPSECVAPVVTAKEMRSMLRRPPQLVLEKVLPDRWCLLPRRPGYFTDATFATHGAPDVYGNMAEEYVWRDAPFAFHLRGGDALRRDPAAVDAILEGFTR